MRTIVMTGGTSGFGELAARQLLAVEGTRLLLGARGSAPTGAEALGLDLASLTSVRSFADAVIERLGASEIDASPSNTSPTTSSSGCCCPASRVMPWSC